MVSLRDILSDPKSRSNKRVRLVLKILGRKGCDLSGSFMVSRSDVSVTDGDACVYSDPLPRMLWDKTVEAEFTVLVKDDKIHLSRPKIIRVVDHER